VIDSGWDPSQPSEGILPGIGLVNARDHSAIQLTPDDRDRIGHGTICANRIRHIAPEVRILPIRVFGRSLQTSLSVLLAGLDYALEREVDIVNMSLGTVSTAARDHLYRRCELARRRGITLVAAGSAGRGWSFPAVFHNVIGVGGGRFTNQYEFHYQAGAALEFVANAVRCPAVTLGARALFVTGPSYAAPTVAGFVALIKQESPRARLALVRKTLARLALQFDDH